MTWKQRDLGLFIKDELAGQSSRLADKWQNFFLDIHPAWTVGPMPSEHMQMKEINYYLRIELATLKTDTTMVRYAIADHISVEDWMCNFKQYILPTVITHELPNTPCQTFF